MCPKCEDKGHLFAMDLKGDYRFAFRCPCSKGEDWPCYPKWGNQYLTKYKLEELGVKVKHDDEVEIPF